MNIHTTQNIVFSSDFYIKVLFTDKLGKTINIDIRSIRPTDKDMLADGLHSLGAETIRKRFFYNKKEFSLKELTMLTEVDYFNHYAFVTGEVINGTIYPIGISRFRRLDENDAAEIAFTIVDRYQGRGLGTLLMALTSMAMLERNITESFSYLYSDNNALKKLLAKFGDAKFKRSETNILSCHMKIDEDKLSKMYNTLKECYTPNIQLVWQQNELTLTQLK